MLRFIKTIVVIGLTCLTTVWAQDTSLSPVEVFEEFCKTEFGAKQEPLVYEKFGKDIKILEAGIWSHGSYSSAAIGWDTNLPAQSYIEYGYDKNLGLRSRISDRFFYVHLVHLTGLEQDKTVYYRMVSTDEAGKTVKSSIASLKTGAPEGAVLVGKDSTFPYHIKESNKTYILTDDLSLDGRAFVIEKVENVCLDLNGKTVVYNNKAVGELKGYHWAYIKGSDFGVYVQGRGVKILNGSIRQGAGMDSAHEQSSIGTNPIYCKSAKDVEVAGVSLEYGSNQMIGIYFHWSEGSAHVHHNVFMDIGSKIANRHGSACRSLKLDKKQVSHVHHNLVRRTRQMGLSGAKLHNNEVYVDSWSTNSFAMSVEGIGGRGYDNRIFATGFNPYGFGWGTKDWKVYNNFVHMVGQDTAKRWGERWGDVNMLCGMRITNYGKGGQKRQDLEYYGNVIVIKGREDSEIRGVEFFTDNSISGVVFRDNVVKVEGLDAVTNRVSCVDAQGHFKKLDTIPMTYKNNTFISNRHHIRFGDDYGKGLYHHFFNCTFIKSGDHPDYSTFYFGGSYWNFGHRIVDCVFMEGTSAEDVKWGPVGSSKCWYSVEWSLHLDAPSGAVVTIIDKNGEEVLNQKVSGKDGVSKALVDGVYSGPEGHNPRDYKEGRDGLSGFTKQEKGPYKVTIIVGGQTASIDLSVNGPTKLKYENNILKKIN